MTFIFKTDYLDDICTPINGEKKTIKLIIMHHCVAAIYQVNKCLGQSARGSRRDSV